MVSTLHTVSPAGQSEDRGYDQGLPSFPFEEASICVAASLKHSESKRAATVSSPSACVQGMEGMLLTSHKLALTLFSWLKPYQYARAKLQRVI